MSKILIIEDVKSIANMLQAILIDVGYDVSSIHDGQKAWEILQNEPPYDLVLLDRELPGLNGLEILKQMKADELLSKTPVIMVTGMSDSQSIIEGIDAGAYYYLTKPTDEKLLLSVIKSAIDEKNDKNLLQKDNQNFEQIFSYLNDARFFCRTLDEARLLSLGLAKIFPDPNRVVLGLHELLVNAVEHGNLEISYEEKTKLVTSGRWQEEIDRRLSEPSFMNRSVSVTFKRSSHEIIVKIRDDGKGFNWKKYVDFCPERAFDPHGRGIALSKMNSFDSLVYEGSGNTVRVAVTL